MPWPTTSFASCRSPAAPRELRPGGCSPSRPSTTGGSSTGCASTPTEHGGFACVAACSGWCGPCSWLVALSAVRKEVVEHARTELQPFKRHSFVDAVEHAGEIEIGRETKRRESEPPNSDQRERLVVGAAEEAVRDGLAFRVFLRD